MSCIEKEEGARSFPLRRAPPPSKKENNDEDVIYISDTIALLQVQIINIEVLYKYNWTSQRWIVGETRVETKTDSYSTAGKQLTYEAAKRL